MTFRDSHFWAQLPFAASHAVETDRANDADPRLCLIFILTIASLLGLTRAAHCADPKAPQPTKTVTYNIAFLLDYSHPDDKPNPPPAPLDPDAPIGTDPPRSRSQAKEDIIKLVRETIDPTSWESGHLPATAIAFEADKLKITQTADNHRALENLFEQLKGDGSEKMVYAFRSTRLPKAKFDNVPLAQAVRQVADDAKLTIEVDWPAFQKTGVLADAPVTIDLIHPTARRAIQAIFDSVIGHEFGTETQATSRLIRIVPNHEKYQPDALITAVHSLSDLPARASGLDAKKPIMRDEALAALVTRLQNRVLHGEHLRVISGQMILTATAAVHRSVSEYLDDLDDEASLHNN